jgi:hypothetical protein
MLGEKNMPKETVKNGPERLSVTPLGQEEPGSEAEIF